jgi:hypothetical protein
MGKSLQSQENPARRGFRFLELSCREEGPAADKDSQMDSPERISAGYYPSERVFPGDYAKSADKAALDGAP